MAITGMNRKEFLKALNGHFTERTIRKTAQICSELPEDAELGAISVALGIIPSQQIDAWQALTGRIPILVAQALAGGIRAHLRALDQKRTSRYAGPKALRFTIMDGDAFGLRLGQRPDHTRITIVMRSKPFAKK